MIAANKQSSFTRTVLACALLALVAELSLTRETRAQQPAVVTQPAITTTAPKGWGKIGSKAAAYVAGVDRSQTHEGLPSAYVKSIQPSIPGSLSWAPPVIAFARTAATPVDYRPSSTARISEKNGVAAIQWTT